MEFLGKVCDESEKEIGDGYPLCKAVAMDIEAKKVILLLALGSTLTEGQKDAEGLALSEKIIEHRCLKRSQLPEDLIGGMVFLCSNIGDFMTGQTLNVDGAML